MRHHTLLFRTFFIALVGFGLSACDSADRLTGPAETQAVAAQEDAATSRLSQERVTRIINRVNAWKAERPFDFGLIDERGGTLSISGGAYVLRVPAGSVSGPTWFFMSEKQGDVIGVDLYATTRGGTFNDKGKTGFNPRVELFISYAEADLAGVDPAQLKIAHVQQGSNRILEVLDSSRLEGQYVKALLEHFSGYIIVAN